MWRFQLLSAHFTYPFIAHITLKWSAPCSFPRDQVSFILSLSGPQIGCSSEICYIDQWVYFLKDGIERGDWSLGRSVIVFVTVNFKERKTLSSESFLPFYWETFCQSWCTWPSVLTIRHNGKYLPPGSRRELFALLVRLFLERSRPSFPLSETSGDCSDLVWCVWNADLFASPWSNGHMSLVGSGSREIDVGSSGSDNSGDQSDFWKLHCCWQPQAWLNCDWIRRPWCN